MKKLLLPVLLLFFIVNVTLAQEEQEANTWRTGGIASLNFSQAQFSNWNAGGENSIGGNAFVNLFANYKAEKYTWDNTLDLGFGIMKQGKRDWFKSDDKIDLSSKYGRHLAGKWYYSALLGFKTQFYEGKESMDDTTKISNFMAPGYLTLSVGFDYKPVDNFSLFISPASARLTFVADDDLSNQGAFGVDPGKKMRFEFGGYARVQYRVDFLKNFTYATKLELFSNYLEKPQNVDVNWENLLNYKITNLFSINLAVTLLYDDDIKFAEVLDDGSTKSVPKLQLREILGIGLTYKF
ncbi:MAG: DUF3078 domain-containing protein [Bacteroidales bacterium]|jgi:hypothetical protein|nr:DUF3078 domain-containing protein [Bacteroidales bacterium]